MSCILWSILDNKVRTVFRLLKGVVTKMQKITPDYAKWRKILYKFNVSFTICILILEIVIFIILKEQDSIDQPLPVYLFLFMLLPTGIECKCSCIGGQIGETFCKG